MPSGASTSEGYESSLLAPSRLSLERQVPALSSTVRRRGKVRPPSSETHSDSGARGTPQTGLQPPVALGRESSAPISS